MHRLGHLWLWVILVTTVTCFPHAGSTENDRPIIGVLTTPLEAAGCITLTQEQASTTSCFHSVYVKWLESAGARVVPIRYDLPDSQVIELAESLNGILFTGGETLITQLESQYMKTAGALLNHTIQSADHVPLWGTCMGIQTLSVLVAGNASVLESGVFHGVDPKMLPLDLTAGAAQSRMLGVETTPAHIRTTVSQFPVTTNLHHDGVDPQTFQTNPKLASFFRVISTNVDSNDRPFVSTIEGIDKPVYGVQWHPERPQFEWRAQPDPIAHTADGIEAMQYFARFFVGEARKNNRKFASETAEDKALIYNYQPTGNSSYQAYMFS
eukprot:TRINITY_DN3464_c0_g1_i1.p1 TRINITY_DN3464_c0_g1~~TRINITY_DN3464_c0_g1_i1.p1  ORF type:complete len:325 (-),score=28.41 TRINITY_DN3464_c0_g1_i1:210-1184(-)